MRFPPTLSLTHPAAFTHVEDLLEACVPVQKAVGLILHFILLHQASHFGGDPITEELHQMETGFKLPLDPSKGVVESVTLDVSLDTLWLDYKGNEHRGNFHLHRI